jgi:hypothetical protein
MDLKKDILYAMKLPAPQRYKVINSIFNRADKLVKKPKVIWKKNINPQHLLIQDLLKLGLKPRQIVCLQPKHFKQNVIIIDNKVFSLSESLYQKLRSNFDSTFIFLTNRGSKYSVRSIQEIRKFKQLL